MGAVWRFVRSAPLTFSWLLILLVTTIVAHSLSTRQLNHVLGSRSTNLHHLASDPVRVLVASLFWVDGSFWFPYALLFVGFLVPAERWLGSLRWLLVGLSAHIVATYLSEGLLSLAIRGGDASTRLINVHDVGVSYFVVAIMGVLTYRIRFPWRWWYLIAMLAFWIRPLFFDVDFSDIGHFTALLLGLAWYPVTRLQPANRRQRNS